MIYLVSRNKTLFGSTRYKEVSFEEALSVLLPLKFVQFDTETKGLDAHTKDLLTVQLGCRENQVVFDWTTMNQEEKLKLKEYFESDRIFIGWNLMFDLGFLYVQDIWPNKIWDGMIAEKLLWLGYPTGMREMSLKAAAFNYLNYDLDKSVRGKIINDGLTEDVVVYAAGDVMWLEDIKDKQEAELKEQELLLAMELECEFVKGLAYFKHCGVHLDVERWRAKMDKDELKLKNATKALNDWVVEWDMNRKNENGDWDIQYPEMEYFDNSARLMEEERRLIKEKYIRSPQDDLEVPYQRTKLKAYKKRVTSLFTRVDRQGNLFEGFDTRPKCIVNWSSPKQVIQLFEILGIAVKTFDKKTKKEKKSIDAKMLKPQKDKFPIIPIFLEYQEAAKVVSTYGENWLKAINPKTGRIHVDFHSIGTDTARVSSGGGVYKLNIQNLPHDKETRACFTAMKGNKWLSADYSGQESAITASVSKDPVMIEILSTGGDLHSVVAQACWPELLGNLTVEEIKTQYKSYRQDAKGVEFGIFYGGDANTLHQNKGFDMKVAEGIYNNFMAKFTGIKKYQDYCRAAVMKNGYILMNPVTKHRAHIHDFAELQRIMNRFKEPDFWSYYREMKRDAPNCDTVMDVKNFFKRKSEIERASINYRIQDRGAMCFKLASIKLFNWIKVNGYLNKVLMCVPAHDEFNLEAPEEIADEVAKVLVQCMIDGGRPFCPNVFLGADVAKMEKCHTDYYIDDCLIMEIGDIIDVTGKTLHNLTKNKYFDLGKRKDYQDFVKADGPFPDYWVH